MEEFAAAAPPAMRTLSRLVSASVRFHMMIDPPAAAAETYKSRVQTGNTSYIIVSTSITILKASALPSFGPASLRAARRPTKVALRLSAIGIICVILLANRADSVGGSRGCDVKI